MHKAKAVVVGCIDFRFRSFIDRYLHEQDFGDSYDLISVAGGSRDFIVPVEENDGRYAWKQLELSLKLHDPDMIIFVDHQDCGGYAQDGTIPAGLEIEEDTQKHLAFLKELKVALISKYPDKVVKALHADFEGNVHALEI